MLTYDQEEKNKMNWTLEIIEIFITPMKSDVMVFKIYNWLCIKWR